MSYPPVPHAPATWKLFLAFAAVYVIWGSTYLAIRFAIETLPPFLMSGTRFILAGAALYGWARARGAPRPERIHWRSTGVVGALLLLGGNGGVVWAEQTVPSGLTALLVAIVPAWMVLLEWLRPHGTAPGLGLTLGLILGFAGLIVLVGPWGLVEGWQVNPAGVGVLLVSSFCWASGSLYSRRASLPESPLLGTGMEMLTGGVLLTLAGTLRGEWGGVDLHAVSTLSVASCFYLIVFGSLVGFTAYIWLLRVTTPARASTYAFVNPVIAVLLGWAVGGEALNLRTLISCTLIVGAVAIITAQRSTGQAGSAKGHGKSPSG